MQGASPLWVQLLTVAIGPPIMATLVAVMSRGWAGTVAGVLGTKVSDTTRKEQAWEFWFVLWGCYVLGIGILVYAHLWR